MKRIPLKSGDEQDALTGFRHWLSFQPGERKRIRRAYNKRLRRELKKELQNELQSWRSN